MRFDGLNFIIAEVVHNEETTTQVEEAVGLQNEITGRARHSSSANVPNTTSERPLMIAQNVQGPGRGAAVPD